MTQRTFNYFSSPEFPFPSNDLDRLCEGMGRLGFVKSTQVDSRTDYVVDFNTWSGGSYALIAPSDGQKHGGHLATGKDVEEFLVAVEEKFPMAGDPLQNLKLAPVPRALIF